jgi:hypothetical protein
MSVSGHSKIHSGHSPFFIPQIHFFCFVPALSMSASFKKHILMKSPMPVGQQQQPTPHPMQRNTTTATKNFGCSSNNNPQSLTQSKAENGNNHPKNARQQWDLD